MINILHKIKNGKKAQEIGKSGIAIEECQKKLELLYDAAQKASSASQVSKLLEEILCMTQQMMRTLASSLLLIYGKNGELYFQSPEKNAGDKLSRMTIKLDSGIANRVLNNSKPLIINDVTKDDRFNKEIDKVTGFTTKSVIAVPLLRGKKVIGILEAINKVDRHEFNKQDLSVLKRFASSESLILLISMVATANGNIEQHQILVDWYKSMMETLIAAADTKDPYASGHSSRVKKYTMMAANSLQLSLEELQTIEFGALLHDIGKLHVHDVVLRKPGPLTDEEWFIMRKHALRGAHMLSGIPYLEQVREIVLSHHERYDGKGYPHGLKGEKIPFGARLVAVADAFDTMTTDRSYRDKMSFHDAIKQLIGGSGTQFCPVAVKAFVSAFKKSEEMPGKEKTNHPAKGKTESATEERRKAKVAAKATKVVDSETYEGDVTITIKSPDSFGQVRQFKKCLEKIDDLKIVLEGWSEVEGNIMVVSVKKPMALQKILNKMSMVEKVDKKRSNLTVMLKLPAASKELKNGFSLVQPR